MRVQPQNVSFDTHRKRCFERINMLPYPYTSHLVIPVSRLVKNNRSAPTQSQLFEAINLTTDDLEECKDPDLDKAGKQTRRRGEA